VSSEPPTLPEIPRVRAPEFPEALDWIHTGGRAVRLADLRGRVVLLDFWTYGCINCIHLAPQLHELARRIPDALAVLGVHSGKHPAERVTARIRDAALRLGVTHPVLNDRQFRVWRAFAVNAWPTVVLIDPQGYVVASRGGERTADELTPVVERLIAAHDAAGTLDRGPLPDWARGIPDTPSHAPGALRFPTKIATDGRRLAIADSAHHRVLVGTRHARDRLRVEHVVGRGTPTSATRGHVAQGATRDALAAAADGPASDASFERPQGLTFGGDGRLYVADTGNHAVRAVDLATGAVRTLAGTGARVRTHDDRAAGALASPWDVAIVACTLVVAMAGTHQLWAIDLDDERARPLAGGRGEALVDAPLADALLAQPMGLAAGDASVCFADAESSAVRVADLSAGVVRTLVGTGLFDFGDRDGEGDAVRLQHAQGLARHPDGRLLVADSYNDALKWLDPGTRRVTTWVRGLHEPAGVALDDGVAYVADTNAHRIAVVHLVTGDVTELSIEGL